MSSRRGRRKGKGRSKGKNKGRNQGSSSSTNSSSTNLQKQNKIDLNKQQNKNKSSKPIKQEEIFVGLDVGSSFIKIAVIQSKNTSSSNQLNNLNELKKLINNQTNSSSLYHSRINLLADNSGERCIPSVITILNANHKEVLIGSEAVKSSIRNYKNSIYYSKYLLSLTQLNNLNIDLFNDQFKQWKKISSKFGMHKAIMAPTFDDNDDKDNDVLRCLKVKYRIRRDNNTFREDVIDNAFVLMLSKIFNVISSQTGSSKINVVSCVPYYYTESQINYYKLLLLKSGFNPLQIMYDYSAAILAVDLDNNYINNGGTGVKYVLCIDFGTFSSTFIVKKLINGLITSSETYTNSSDKISGIVLDSCLISWLIKDFQQKNKGCYIEIENSKTRLKLISEISRIKRVLSSGSDQVLFDIESLYEGIDYHFKLSRAKFEGILYDIIKLIPNWINNQINLYKKENKLFNSFSSVIISGGLAEIPKIQNQINNIFNNNPDSLMTQSLIQKGIQSNFVHVYGCGMQACTLSIAYKLQLNTQINSFKNIINVNKPYFNKYKNKNNKNIKNKNRNQNQNQNQNQNKKQINNNNDNSDDIFADKNVFLNKYSHNNILISSKQIRIFYNLSQQQSIDNNNNKRLLYSIPQNTALPFESNYKILENEIIEIVNNNNNNLDINNDLNISITFLCEIMDDDCKTIMDTISQSMITILKSKKKTKNIAINFSLDTNNDLNISCGKQKLLFELDQEEDDDDDNDDNESDDNTDLKTDDLDDDDTIDID